MNDELISRQAAIDAVHKNYDTILDFKSDGKTISSSIEDILSALPPAQPEQLTGVQDILQYLDEYLHPIVSPEHWNVYSELYDMISCLSSAQPEKEKAKRVLWTGWKGTRNTRYKCPNCTKPVKNDDIYCHRCGQRLMFPHVSWTPYVEGQKQELIVRWDDE